MMDWIWTTLTILITIWLVAAAVAALIRGPQPRMVRLERDGLAFALPGLGLLAYVLILDVGLNPPAAIGALVVGGGLGFLATWRNGSLPAFGLPVVWGSPWQMVLLALSGVTTTIGAMSGDDTVMTTGLLALCSAVGFGMGAYGYEVVAAADAARSLNGDLDPVQTCPACRSVTPAGIRSCTRCGQHLSGHCPSCGVQRTAPDAWCQSCGAPQIGPLHEAAEDEVTVRFCHACSTRVSMDDQFCRSCGILLAPACPLCGSPVMLEDETCPLCGIELEVAEAAVDSGLLHTIVAEVEAELRAEETAAPAPVTVASGSRPADESAQQVTGAPIQPAVGQDRLCPSCAAPAQPAAAFCSRCGMRLS